MVTETCVCKQETCQAACSKHAGRFVTASFTWTVGSIRPADIKLIPMQWLVRCLRVTAPNGTKRKRFRLAIHRGSGRTAAGTMPRRCWDKLEINSHYWFNQHGHGNLRMQARAVASCMQQACGPFRHRTLHMDSRTHQTRRDAIYFHAMVRAAPPADGT